MGASGRASRMAGALLLAGGALLAGCGGGGGGGDGGGGGGGTPVTYAGNTSAAVVSATNASALTANVVGGDSGAVISAIAVAGEMEATRGRVELAQRLSRRMRESAQLAGPDPNSLAGLQVNRTDLCDNGVGTVNTSGSINDISGTGTLTFTYSGCLIGSDTFTGVATYRIDAFDGTFFTDTTTTYGRLAVRGPGLSVDASGTLRSQLNVGLSMETVTENLVTLNNLSGLTSKSANLVYVYSYDNFFAPNSYSAQVNGRLYHHVHGYVDIVTDTPLTFGSLSQVFPGSGQFTMSGSGGGAIRAIALSTTRARLELDVDANGVFEIMARLGWSDLTGPAGADLGDSDGDGMHNSWESANGLNPNDAADATSDWDGDGASAQVEYFAGTNPTDIGSAPASVGLSVTISDSPDPATVGASLTYTITVTNSGATPASDVVVTDSLPGGLTNVSVNTGKGACSGTATVTCALGTVSPFSNVVITITGSPAAAGLLSNTVSVTTTSFDADLSDNSATASTTVNPAAPNLGVAILDSPDPVMVGANVTYMINVTNTGAIAATDVVVENVLPPSVNLVSVSTELGTCSGTTTVTCDLGTVNPFTLPAITIVVATTTEGALINTVSVTTSASDSDLSNNSATANTTVSPAIADLAVTMTDSPDPAFVGGDLTYTVGLSNTGSSPANDVALNGTLPAGVDLMSATPTQGTCSPTPPLSCSLGTLGVSGSATITIVVAPTTDGVKTFTVSATSTTTDANPSNNSATSTSAVGLPGPGIQGMIDLAADGDTILVPPGNYAGEIDFKGKNVTLESQSGPAATVINGGGGTAVRMGPNGTIRGFTITGSFSSAIVAQQSGSKIIGNVFEGNSNGLSGIGAAIHGNSASPTIASNIFRNNTCDSQLPSGVVSFINSSSPLIVNNVFANNACRGLNLALPQFNAPSVLNNTFVGNSVGIRVSRQVSQVTQIHRNNILVQNGVGLQLDFGTDADNPVWTNNLVFGNSTNYSGTTDPTGTNANLSADPLFVDAGAGNYRLQPGSPAINAGSPTDAPAVDFDGTARPQGPAVDIGAFEAL
jgi:uncharacterized repeat protein (TIGR01451 family)